MENGIDPGSAIFATACRFERGKRYLVTAPSGKGKSTFMHILYGLRGDYEGEVTLSGRHIRLLKPDDWSEVRQQQLSIVFQDLRLFMTLTGMENIVLKAQLTGEVREEKILEMAARLGMQGLLGQKCETMSYGQRQRIAILRALFQPFDYLLLDEPFSHLDEGNVRAAMELIQEVCAAQEAGFILVSLGEKYGKAYDEEMIL